MTKADARRIANAINYMSLKEAESALNALANELGEDAREAIVAAICDINSIRGGMHCSRQTDRNYATCAAGLTGLDLVMASYGGDHRLYIGKKEYVTNSMHDVWALIFELRECAPDHGRTHGISRLYPVRSLIPPTKGKKEVKICISANDAV